MTGHRCVQLSLLASLWLLAACATQDGGSEEVACESTDDCPIGQVCSSGECTSSLPRDVGSEPFVPDVARDANPADAGDDAERDMGTAPDGDEADAEPDGTTDGSADAAPDVPEDVGPNLLVATITAPEAGSTYEEGYVFWAEGTIEDPRFEPTELTATWRSTVDGDLWSGPVEADGTTRHRVTGLSSGSHRLELVAENPLGQRASDLRRMAVCTWGAPDSFDADIGSSNWEIYGDAYWDEGGWLEMTGLGTGRRGAIFNTGDPVNPGDVQIRFRIYTGGGAGSGADGFAMSVFEAPTVETLETWIADFSTGGCLGYGISGTCGSYEDVEAFHIEFDTWYNSPGDGSGVLDPTTENHIGITLNGNPGEHVLWAEVPNLEDEQWHDIEVQIDGARVTVRLDGETIISEAVPGFRFKGGYLGFTGTTGLYTNWHRFDDLQILEECLVE